MTPEEARRILYTDHRSRGDFSRAETRYPDEEEPRDIPGDPSGHDWRQCEDPDCLACEALFWPED